MSSTLSGTTLPRTMKLGTSEEGENKLHIHDASRFRAIVEESMERLDLLGMVMQDSTRRKSDEGQGRNKKDVYHLMVNQKDLEARYEELMFRRSNLKGLQNKNKYQANQDELKEIANALKESSTSIYQNLKDQPTVAGNLNKIQKDRGELAELLDKTIVDLKLGVFESLVREVNIRIDDQRSLPEMELAHEKTRESLKNLEQELRMERENFNRDMESKNLEIHDLTQELKHLKKVTALTLRYEKDTALAQRETIARTRKRHLDDIREQILASQEAVGRDATVSTTTLKFLGEQKTGLETLASEWEQKYEQDFGALTAELDDLTGNRDEDNVSLTTLQERWKIDKNENSIVVMEKKQREIEVEAKKKLMKYMNLAQAKINFMWRVYNKSKPKGKKGKKGKKGSKKGKVTVKG